jgi:hypothetical protein
VLARQGRIPPVDPDADWWLIDDDRLVVFHYADRWIGRLDRVELVTDRHEIRSAVTWMIITTGWAQDEMAAHPVAA